MLVRKINPEWSPVENPGLKVGEVIEKTNPRQLILEGNAEAVDEDGNVISAYDLYGVVVNNEWEEFQEWQAMKKAQNESKRLQKEAAKLEEELAKIQSKTKPETKDSNTNATAEMEWKELLAIARQLSGWNPSMKRPEVEALVDKAVADGEIKL